MNGRRPRLPAIDISLRRAAVVLGIICLLVVPTSAAINNAFFTGQDEEIEIEKIDDSPNKKYVNISDQQVSINITNDEYASAKGINPNAVTEFDRLFRITNVGNETRIISTNYDAGGIELDQETISFYTEGSDTSLAENITLEPDESIAVGMRIDTTGEDAAVGTTLTIDLVVGFEEPEPVAKVSPSDPRLTREGDTIDFSGDASTGVDLNYSWSIIDGDGELINANTTSPTYQAPTSVSDDQDVTVALTVTDGDGRTDTTRVTFRLLGNEVPIPDAGGPYQVRAGESIRLDGQDSSDPDGTTEEYEWSIDEGVGNLSNTNSSQPTFTAPANLDENATVSVELTVTDNDSATSSDQTTITIIANRPPTVEFGGPYTVGANKSISLTDVNITDPDGSVTNRTYSIVAGPGFLETDNGTPIYTAPSGITETTNVTVEVTVTGDGGRTVTETTKITIVASVPPNVDAGGPYSVKSGGSFTLSEGSFTDPDGTISKYAWQIMPSGENELVRAANRQPGGRTTHTVEYTIGSDSNAAGNSLNSIVISYPDGSADVSDIDRDDVFSVGIDTDGDGTIDADATNDIEGGDDDGVKISDGGNTLTIELSGNYNLESGDSLLVGYQNVINPESGNYSVTTEINGEASESGSISIGEQYGGLSETDTEEPIYRAPNVTQETTVNAKVTIIDDSGAVARDDTQIKVTNRPPIVDRSGPYTVQTGNETTIEIRATDPDGNIANYTWSIISGGGLLDIPNENEEAPTYTAPESITSNTTTLINVTVVDDDGAATTRTIEVGVSEPGSLPDIQVSNSTIDYEIGRGKNVSRSVTIENNGTAPLIINSTTILPLNQDQFQVIDPLEGRMLNAGDSKTIAVRFSPEQAGNFEGTLEILSNADGSEVTEVDLQGTALAPEIETPDSANFTEGERSITLTISNNGDPPVPIDVRKTTIVGRNPGVFSIGSGGAPFTLDGGESQGITINYDPEKATGVKTAQLRIKSDARNGQVDIWLSNTGWYVVVDDMADSLAENESADEGDESADNQGYENAVEVAARNFDLADESEIFVNTSVRSTEDQNAQVQETALNVTEGAPNSFSVRYLHDERRPPQNGATFEVNTSERETLEYITVEHPSIDNSQIERTFFRVEVDKSALPANISAEEVFIRHRIDGEWEKENARLIRETGGGSLVYQINTTGFSQFVVTGPNEVPTAEAGNDVTTGTGETVELDAGGSIDPDGSIAGYEWEIIDGPGSLFAESTVAPSYAVPETVQPGQTATIQLTVTDNSGATATDTVTIEITSPTTSPGNGTAPGNGTGGGGAPGGAPGGGNNVTPSTPTGTPTGGGTGTPGETPTEGSGPAIVKDGIGIRFSDSGEQSDTESLSDVISIADVGLPDAGEGDEERDGPKAAIRADSGDESATQTVATNESGVSLAVANETGTEREIDLKGADALTLVERPILLDGTHSLFRSKDSIADDLRMVRQVEITVPEEYENRSAVLTMTVSKSRFGESDPEDATIARQNDGWQPLATEVIDRSGDTVVLQAETPGFSRFAVFAQNDVSYAWEVETYDEPLTGPSIEPTFEEPGFYNTTLTVTDSFGRTDTANYTILANDVPEVEIQWGSNTVPTNETIVMNATVEDELGNVTYTWQFPDGTEKTGRTVNHTLPPNATGEIVVIAEDEFGAQGQDSISISGGSSTYSVEVLSYNLQIEQNLLWFLVALLGLLALLALLRRFGLGGLFPVSTDHPPAIEVFEDPTIDYQEQWAIIPTLRVTDRGDDLATIEVTVLSDLDGTEYETPVAREDGVLEGESEYEGTNVVVSAESGSPFETEQAYAVRVTVTDEAGTETVEERPVTAEDEFVFVGETSGPDLHPSLLDGEREPGDD